MESRTHSQKRGVFRKAIWVGKFNNKINLEKEKKNKEKEEVKKTIKELRKDVYKNDQSQKIIRIKLLNY